MIIHPAQQGSAQWLEARAAIPTASEFDNLVTPEFKIRTGQMPKSYLHRKLAEWWLGGPLADLSAFSMEQGNILEDEAKPWFTLQTGIEIESVGLCTTDDGKIGASPDGLIGDDCGIEIKCPEPQTHTGYLLCAAVPKDYLVQVHGCMFVTGRPRWKFLSYRRRFPAHLVEVERNPVIEEALTMALELFRETFEYGQKRMIELNGGPPPRNKPIQRPAYAPDENDVPN